MLMVTLFEKSGRTQAIDKFRQEMRWQPFVAFATILASVAAVAGIILAVAHIIR